jgi:hypothetical protein
LTLCQLIVAGSVKQHEAQVKLPKYFLGIMWKTCYTLKMFWAFTLDRAFSTLKCVASFSYNLLANLMKLYIILIVLHTIMTK